MGLTRRNESCKLCKRLGRECGQCLGPKTIGAAAGIDLDLAAIEATAAPAVSGWGDLLDSERRLAADLGRDTPETRTLMADAAAAGMHPSQSLRALVAGYSPDDVRDCLDAGVPPESVVLAANANMPAGTITEFAASIDNYEPGTKEHRADVARCCERLVDLRLEAAYHGVTPLPGELAMVAQLEHPPDHFMRARSLATPQEIGEAMLRRTDWAAYAADRADGIGHLAAVTKYEPYMEAIRHHESGSMS